MAGGRMRTFVAVGLEERVRAALAREIGVLQMAGADVAWTRPENLHVTLRFLGDLAHEEVVPVARAIGAACSGLSACRPDVRGLDAFPDLAAPRVLVAGLEGDVTTLHEIWRRLQEGLKALGFRPEPRPLRLHVTLGRVRSTRALAELLPRLEAARGRAFGDTLVDRVELMLSDLSARESRYTTMEEFELADPA